MKPQPWNARNAKAISKATIGLAAALRYQPAETRRTASSTCIWEFKGVYAQPVPSLKLVAPFIDIFHYERILIALQANQSGVHCS